MAKSLLTGHIPPDYSLRGLNIFGEKNKGCQKFRLKFKGPELNLKFVISKFCLNYFVTRKNINSKHSYF